MCPVFSKGKSTVIRFVCECRVLLMKILLSKEALLCTGMKFLWLRQRTLLTLHILEGFEVFYSEEWLRQLPDEVL